MFVQVYISLISTPLIESLNCPFLSTIINVTYLLLSPFLVLVLFTPSPITMNLSQYLSIFAPPPSHPSSHIYIKSAFLSSLVFPQSFHLVSLQSHLFCCFFKHPPFDLIFFNSCLSWHLPFLMFFMYLFKMCVSVSLSLPSLLLSLSP